MKNVLMVGGGSKWGLEFTKELVNQGSNVDLITGSEIILPNVNSIKIDWYNLNRDYIKSKIDQNKIYDLIFFNQNSGGAPNDHFLKPNNEIDLSTWNYHIWINCQLPYVIIHHLSKGMQSNTKIGWMLTGLIHGHDRNMFQYAGYATVKANNLHIMRGFSQFHHGIFFAINPGWFPIEDYKQDAKKIIKVINNLNLSDTGKTFNKDASEWI